MEYAHETMRFVCTASRLNYAKVLTMTNDADRARMRNVAVYSTVLHQRSPLKTVRPTTPQVGYREIRFAKSERVYLVR